MSIMVQDICTAIEDWAPAGLAYSWDRAGLHTGDPKAEIDRVLVCLTVTQEAFRQAQKRHAGMIVAHHPLFWEPLRHLRQDDPATRFLVEVAASGTAVYSAHTNLDIAARGVSVLLAQQLGLTNLKPLAQAPQARQVKLVTFVPESHLAQVREAVCAAGAGLIGAYTHCTFSTPGAGTFLPDAAATPFSGQKGVLNEEPERRLEVLLPHARIRPVVHALKAAHPYEEVAYDLVTLENTDPGLGLGVIGDVAKPTTLGLFASLVVEALDLTHARVCGKKSGRVRRVAVCGGAGADLIAQVPADTDVYVTGDLKYHDAQAAVARGLAVIDAGHGGTEACAVPALAAFLREHFPKLTVEAWREPEAFQVVGRGRKSTG